MSRRGRAVVIAVGGALILLGLVLQVAPGLVVGLLGPLSQPGAGPILLGTALVLSSVFEGRYKRLRKAGAINTRDRGEPAGWVSTGEIFRDEESGRWVQVWFNRDSGERRYEPTDQPR